MQRLLQPTAGQTTSFFSSVLQQTHAILTPKRAGFTLLSAFAFVGAAAGVSMAIGPNSSPPQSPSYTIQKASTPDSGSTSPLPADTAANTPPASSDSSGSTHHVQLNVNGRNIAVPQNGSVQQTVPTTSGTGQSSVSVNSSSNDSSSSLNVNISTNSTTTGDSSSSSSTFISQDGGSVTLNGD